MEKKNERIFISYKRVDTKRVDALRKAIEHATGETCWIDRDGIESDAQFVEVIMDAIDQCEIFLFMRSKAHNNITNHSTDWTIREVNYALGEKKRIVFINLDNAPLPRWFKFMFPQQQEIDASDTLSLEHFYADLCSWLKVEVRKETVLKGKKAEGEDILNILNSILVFKEKNERKKEENLRKIGERQHTQTIKLSSAKKYIQTFNGHTDTVRSVEFSPDGSRIVSTSWDNTVRIWDTETANNIKILKGKFSVNSASFCSFDGKKIVFASSDNAIRIWDTEIGKCIGKITGHTDSVNSVAFSPNGSQIVSASDDKTIRIWNALTGECIQILKGHSSYTHSAGFSPDGKKIVYASEKTVRTWDISGF